VILDGTNDEAKVKALARFIVDGVESEYLASSEQDTVVLTESPRRAEGGAGRGAAPWITAGASVAALGVGVYLLRLDGDLTCTGVPSRDCPEIYNTDALGYATLGLGAALAGLTVYLFLRETGASETPAAIAIDVRADRAVAGYCAEF
jgi:hypothetical protein